MGIELTRTCMGVYSCSALFAIIDDRDIPKGESNTNVLSPQPDTRSFIPCAGRSILFSSLHLFLSDAALSVRWMVP